MLYLPPYHPKFNSIELAWANIKNYIRKNLSYSFKDLQNKSLPLAISQFSQERAQNIINSMIRRYRECLTVEVNTNEIETRTKNFEDIA